MAIRGSGEERIDQGMTAVAKRGALRLEESPDEERVPDELERPDFAGRIPASGFDSA
jgi:hypothetical protein